MIYYIQLSGSAARFIMVASIILMQAMGTKRCDEVLEFSVQEGKTSRGDRKKKILKVITSSAVTYVLSLCATDNEN